MRREAIAAIGAVVLAAITFATCGLEHRSPREAATSWKPASSMRAAKIATQPAPEVVVLDAGGFDSGIAHIQFYDCTGCLASLTATQQALDVRVGLGYFDDAGAYVSTPSQSYYLDGGPALLDDGGLLNPYVDEAIPEANPVVPNRYRMAILDRDYPTMTAIAMDAGVTVAPVAALDVTWFSTLLPDGGVLLPDGGVTSVAALTDGAVAVGLDSGIHIEAGGSMSLGDH